MFIVDFMHFLKEEFPKSSGKNKLVLLIGSLAWLIIFAFLGYVIYILAWQELLIISSVFAGASLVIGWSHTMASYTSWRIASKRPVKYATNFGPR